MLSGGAKSLYSPSTQSQEMQHLSLLAERSTVMQINCHQDNGDRGRKEAEPRVVPEYAGTIIVRGWCWPVRASSVRSIDHLQDGFIITTYDG
jgi:hypothetical protein